jgi:hypothetical protein
MGASFLLMQKSFPLFLRQLHLGRKSFKEMDILKTLSEDDFEELKNLGLFKRSSDLAYVTCESCDDPHAVPVKCEGEKPYISCVSDSLPNYLEPSSIRRWELDTFSFLQGMTVKLGIDDQVELLGVDDLWLLGTVVKDHIPHTCFFYHGRNMEVVSEFLSRQRGGSERQIVITSSKGFYDGEGSQEFLTFDAGLLVELRAGSLQFKKKIFEQYLNSLRLVQFDLKSGRLCVGGEPIATIALNTPHYHFAAFLWEKFGEPRSNSEIRRHVSKKRRYNYDREPNQVCYDLKGKIKLLVKGDERKQKMIDEIFTTSPTKDNQNGFMMQNPTL